MLAISTYYILILVPVIVVIGVVLYYCYYYINPRQIIIRTLSNLENKPPNSVKTNELTKMTGTALSLKTPLIAPLSKRPCVFYSITIEQKKGTRTDPHWKRLISEDCIQDFFVERNGEYVLIKPTQIPKNYMYYVSTDIESNTNGFNDPSQEFLAILKTHNIDVKNILGINKTLRCKEGIIGIGDAITVAGMPKWIQLDAPIPNYPYSKVVTLEAGVKQKIMFTNKKIKEKRRS